MYLTYFYRNLITNDEFYSLFLFAHWYFQQYLSIVCFRIYLLQERFSTLIYYYHFFFFWQYTNEKFLSLWYECLYLYSCIWMYLRNRVYLHAEKVESHVPSEWLPRSRSHLMQQSWRMTCQVRSELQESCDSVLLDYKCFNSGWFIPHGLNNEKCAL